MKITIIGRGGVGAGLARLLEPAGHEVTTLGRDGGDASDADVVMVAVPGNAIEDAIGKVQGSKARPCLTRRIPSKDGRTASTHWRSRSSRSRMDRWRRLLMRTSSGSTVMSHVPAIGRAPCTAATTGA